MKKDNLEGVEKWEEFIKPIEPLPNGFDKLKNRIAEKKPSGHRYRTWAFALDVAAVCLIVFFLVVIPFKTPSQDRTIPNIFVGHPKAVALGLTERRVTATVSDPRIPETDEVVFFWVHSSKVEK
jgi:hypothetical protein